MPKWGQLGRPACFSTKAWYVVFLLKKRFSVEQIVGVLKQAEVGVPVVEVIRKAGISEQTFYRWKEQYVGLESDQVREMKQPQDENGRLKQLVAELSLDKTMLQDVLSKSGIAVAAPESTAKQDSENCTVPFSFQSVGRWRLPEPAGFLGG